MDKNVSLIVVTGNEDIIELFGRFSSTAGIEVRVFALFADLEEELAARPPDAIVLDTERKQNAWMVAARVRARSPVGIVLLTDRPTEEDRQLSLSMGIDYYLSKPVNLAELESMIRNLSRRAFTRTSRETGISEGQTFNGERHWTLQSDSWKLVAPNDKFVKLSSAEYRTLRMLLDQPGRPWPRNTMNSRLGKSEADLENRSLDVLVSRMRRKVEKVTGVQLPVRSARGMGYVFAAPGEVTGDLEDWCSESTNPS